MPGFLLRPPSFLLDSCKSFCWKSHNELDHKNSSIATSVCTQVNWSAVKDSCEWSPQKWHCFRRWRNPFHHFGKKLSVTIPCITTTFHITVVEDTIPHHSWRSVYSWQCSNELKSFVGEKKKTCQFIIMLDENAVSECGTKPVCISGIYMLCFYWQVLWLKFASVTVYYPVHTRGCENLE